MLNQDYTAKVLNLEEVMITNVENISNRLHITIELPRRAHVCPSCGALTDRVHDYRMQLVKDIPLGRETFLHLRKRRYRCACGKRFFEKNTFLPRYHRVTGRMVAAIISAFQSVISAKDIAAQYHVSAVTAMRYFTLFNKKLRRLPKVLSIDEFKGNSGGEKFHCVLTDPQNKEVLDVLPNRFEGDLVHYFKRFPNKQDVQYFICDMNTHFRNVSRICFPKATVVADKYHVVRQVYWGMEKVRKNAQKSLSVHFRKYFKKSRGLLMKRMEKLTAAEMDQLALMFEISPRLADAYRIKNEFLTVIRSDSSETGRKRLTDWIVSAEMMDMPEFNECIKACRNWFQEILNAMDVPWTNGFTEGCNNKTKVLKRVSYGMRNFDHFRKRILFCHTGQVQQTQGDHLDLRA